MAEQVTGDEQHEDRDERREKVLALFFLESRKEEREHLVEPDRAGQDDRCERGHLEPEDEQLKGAEHVERLVLDVGRYRREQPA